MGNAHLDSSLFVFWQTDSSPKIGKSLEELSQCHLCLPSRLYTNNSMVAPNDLVVPGRNVRQTEQRGQMIYEFADAWIKLFDKKEDQSDVHTSYKKVAVMDLGMANLVFKLGKATTYLKVCVATASTLMALSHCHKPVLWSKWPLASSLLRAIKTCRQACPPGYLMHFL